MALRPTQAARISSAIAIHIAAAGRDVQSSIIAEVGLWMDYWG
jgi:hypothetical protein